MANWELNRGADGQFNPAGMLRKKTEYKSAEDAMAAARKGNAAAIEQAAIEQKERNADPAYAERMAQEDARKGNANKLKAAQAGSSIPEGKQVANSKKAVAEAQPGDWIIRSSGEKYILKPQDIKWAKDHLVSKSAPVPPVPPAPAPEAQPDVQPEALSNENRYTMSAGAEDKDGNGVITLEEAQAAMKEAEAAYIRAKQVYNAKKAEAKKAKMASMPANPAQAQQNMGNGPATN